MNRKETLRALLNNPAPPVPVPEPATDPTQQSADPDSAPPVPSHGLGRAGSGAVRTMGVTLQKLSAEAENARALRAQLASGERVVELDPERVEPSFVSDRLSREQDGSFQALVESIRAHGQQVPVLVRPLPGLPDRFQVAYGHRRLRAAAVLGQKVRAVVRELTDAELVIAQGKENNERKDLSFIERALFARRLEERGFDRPTLTAALSVDKAEVARFLSVARAVPDALLAAIGPAPKAGRPRWLALAQLLAAPASKPVVEGFLSDPGLHRMDSDGRFLKLFAALSRQAPSERLASVWKDPVGRPAVRVEPGVRTTRITIDERLAPAFGSFIASKLDELYDAFTQWAGDRGVG